MRLPDRTMLRLGSLAQRLREDRRGVSFLEFALILPVLITLGFYGTELATMATVNMQIGQMATSVADNASRLGQTDNSAVTPTVTQTQIDSIMTGALVEGAAFNFEANGRIILSSLERDSATGRQYIHWQRCKGSLKANSKYGKTGTGLTGTTLAGMGNPLITAVDGSAVMYVEIYYTYQPLFGSMFAGNPSFHREAAFMIRDDRNLTPGITPTNTDTSCS
ncbi:MULTISPECIES: TadE/TadG family type IV pilus assembly protein [unclassified Novosphingobium]|uniref:TadE/TadG family type IV pilus assembly protein n=1 Tax=unclassified Novosphingobium TaxID=2644732 RepID=UPI001F3D2E54|nr:MULTISPECIES: pilus assembly protein TadE [unclassified Novosphingobium]